MKKATLLLLGIAAVLAGAGCKKAGSAANSNEIPIGEYASLTGGTASFGQSSHNGTIMAIEEINAAGGVLGKQLRLFTEDDQSKAGEAATVVRKLISRNDVVAVLGEVASSRSLEAAPICQSNKIPMITPASTNPKVTEVGDFIFRVCFTDQFQGGVIGKFALSRGWKRIAVLTDVKQDYSVGLSQFAKEYISKNGGTIVSDQSYSSGDKDFKAQLTSIKSANPDAILIPGYYTEIGLIASQARQLGIEVPMFGGDGWDSKETLLEVAGKAVEGCFFSNHFAADDPSPVIQEFVKNYQAKYNKVPDAMAALGYDSAKILADAIQRAGSTENEKIRDAIGATKDFQGVTGKITLDDQRNAVKTAVIVTIKDGEFKYVETVTP